MPIYIDVDTAVAVPVNFFPLTDSGDFVTRETAVAYNAAGMDLVWNFVTTSGVTTQTAVTPTTSGDYDWTHVGDGIYKIEIPASGGASINNTEEGHGWFSGVCTGVLPWVSPLYIFRAAAVNNLLIDDGTLTLPGQAAPPNSPTFAEAIAYLYKAWRNKKTSDGSTVKLFADDASTVDQKATISDDGSTFTEGEVASGP